MTGATWREAMRGGVPVIEPVWPVVGIDAFVSLRAGGGSAAPYAGADGRGGLNLAQHVGDDPATVERNRARLGHAARSDLAPAWLEQQHGAGAVRLPGGPGPRIADAAWSTEPGIDCAVLVADCLPVLVASHDGRAVGIAHAGWRGLAGGVVEALLAAMATAVDRATLVAWLGPCIGPTAFEVGPEVRAAFVDVNADDARHFTPGRGDRLFADLAGLAASRLMRSGVATVVASGLCTVGDAHRFFSYRRDGVTGRFGAFLRIAAPPASTDDRRAITKA